MAERYALYYAPEQGSPLAAFGARWLGRDACTGAACTQAMAPGVADDALHDATALPRRYGFHATLKAPFRLTRGASPDDLLAAVAAFARETRPVAAPPLELATLDDFLALRPSGPCPELGALAASCVTRFEDFRAPAGAEELERRRARGLTPAQESLLARFGYPFVLGEYRFHLTLTGAVRDERLRARLMGALEMLTLPLTREPFEVREICVFSQQGENAPFFLQKRFPLAGDIAVARRREVA